MNEKSHTTPKANILIVDDTPANLRLLSNMLTQREYKVRSAINGPMGLRAAQAAPPDLILLDINMPEMNGYEVCEQLKADPVTRDIPVIFISALDEVEDKIKAFAAGGVDYVTKPFQFAEVLARVETHLALRRLQRDLEHEIVQRDHLIAELDAYAHTVAHDLKNPLAALIGFSALLENRVEQMTPEKAGETARRITQIGHKMTNIIDELLLLTSVRKMEDIEIVPLHMDEVIADALDRLCDMLDGVEVEIAAPDTWPVALGHGAWVEEVWANYISNAIKYGGEPPHVLVRAEPLEKDSVRFCVRDNGAGLSTDAQAKLFAPFERLNQARAGGHGLGLSIVRRIVEKLGGDVGVESAEGEGCTFWFTLPQACYNEDA